MTEDIKDPRYAEAVRFDRDIVRHFGDSAVFLTSTEKQDNGNKSKENRISQLLNSQETIERIRSFGFDDRIKVIGDLVEYATIFDDVDLSRLQSCMDHLTSRDSMLYPDKYPNGHKYAGEELKYSAFTFLAAKQLELSETESKESKRKLFNFFNEKKNGPDAYYYHSFNPVFEASIQKNGLDPDMRTWDWQELEEIQGICSKASYNMALGWSSLNCKGKISMTNDPGTVYRYARASPEWFAQFVAEGHHMIGPGIDKEAFYKRDYAAARGNMEIFCDNMTSGVTRPKISIDDKSRVLDFFEKYWAEFAKDDSPRVALCRKRAVDDYLRDMDFDALVHSFEGVRRRPITTDEIVAAACGVGMSYFREYDKQISHKIDPQDVTILALPSYKRVFC